MFQAIELIAVVTAATYGILEARAARMDPLGVITAAFAVAFGGGTLRDLFLDRHPLFWIANAHYTVIVFFMAVVTCLVPKLPVACKRYLAIPDALGLGLFSIVGCQYAIEAGTTWFVATLLGVITGTFGGVIGDVLCNRVPSLFRKSPLYATCSFAGCWVFLGVGQIELPEPIGATAGIVSIVVMRLAAIYWNVTLPELDDGCGA
ncbi:MAG: trimeric intracellular cation channel family protein [Thermoguttaceae bacterium]